MVLLGALGRFEAYDEVPFKAAGREWAASGRFAAPEMTGFYGLVPPPEDVWFAHMPLYTFFFGLFVLVVGFGGPQCIVFDALIHCALATLTYAITRRLGPATSRWVAASAAMLVLPLGTWGRADELAMCFGFAALLVLLRDAPRPADGAIAGTLLGLAAAASGGVAGLIAIIAVIRAPRWRLWLVAGACGAVTFLVVVLPFALKGHAYRQFLAHSLEQAHADRLATYASIWQFGKPYLAIPLAAILTVVARWWYGAPWAAGEWRARWLGPLLTLAVLAILVPKYLYIWFVGPWIIAVVVLDWATLLRSWRSRTQGQWVALACLGVAVAASYLLAARPFIQNVAIMATLPSTQRLGYNARLLDETIPKGSRVLAREFWWALGKDRTVYHLNFSVPPGDIDYIVLSGNGSAEPGRPYVVDRRDRWGQVEGTFDVVLDRLNHQPVTLFGIRFTNSAYGFGPYVLRRR